MKKIAKDYARQLKEQLAESFKEPVPVAKSDVGATEVAPVQAAHGREGDVAAGLPVESTTGRSERVSTLLKPTEVQKADQILDVLYKARRRRGGISEVISIAIRLCPLDAEAIGRAADENRASDRRGKAKKTPKS